MGECISNRIEPANALEVAEVLRESADRKRRLCTGGSFSKQLMAGPRDEGAEVMSTAKLDRLLAYEPRDLTVSVEAGMPWRTFQALLQANRQMVPLDPGFVSQATVGGVLSANVSGPRRRQYGTARDLVIGMEFATLEGRLVQSGGMVVKNVAGLDMAKLMIGSFGTLGVITVANFKVLPEPPEERTFAVEFDGLDAAMEARDQLMTGAVQPGAIDLMNPELAAEHGFRGWTMLLWFGGNEALMRRASAAVESLGQARPKPREFWDGIHSLTERFVTKFADGVVVRISSLLGEVRQVLEELNTPALSRAGTGVTYAYFFRSEAAVGWMAGAAARGRKVVVEFASQEARTTMQLWPHPGSDFEMMKRVKRLFDPDGLLNRGRFYRHF